MELEHNTLSGICWGNFCLQIDFKKQKQKQNTLI